MILLRLSPLVPNHALDYISGVTSISLKDYWFALIGIVPSTVAFCYIGATASSVAEGKDHANHQIQKTTMLLIGLFFAFAGAIVASYYAKKELDKLLNIEEYNNTNDDDDDEYNEMSSYYHHNSNNGIQSMDVKIT
jgi:uncharacterized membrane protein YdjX (TVP38/TMEM64 family)